MRRKCLFVAAFAVLLKLAMPTAFAQGTAFPLILTGEGHDCTQATVGTTVSCGLLRVLAIGGPITFASDGPYTLTGDTSNFFVVPFSANGCQANQILAQSSNCFVGEVFFRPTSIGNKTLMVTSRTSSGIPSSMMYLSVGHTYAWTGVSAWTGCLGGSGQWSYSSWSPAQGCGDTHQTRSATCASVENSGTEALRVVCLRDDGVEVAGSFCAGELPPSSRSCTPWINFSCGAQEPTSRIAALTDTCSYAWSTGVWSAPSDTCSASTTRSRSVVCQRSDGSTVPDSLCISSTRPEAIQTVSEFSGCTYAWQTGEWAAWSSQCAESATRFRSLQCLRSDGTEVADAQCTGSRPASIENGANLAGCEYSWVMGAFGACAGGTAHWFLGDWAPLQGCGPTDQTRVNSCVVDDQSGQRVRTVGCRRSDGAAVSDSQCEALTRPESSERCTPASAPCESEPAGRRNTVLTSACAEADDSPYAGCTPDSGQGRYCVFAPL